MKITEIAQLQITIHHIRPNGYSQYLFGQINPWKTHNFWRLRTSTVAIGINKQTIIIIMMVLSRAGNQSIKNALLLIISINRRVSQISGLFKFYHHVTRKWISMDYWKIAIHHFFGFSTTFFIEENTVDCLQEETWTYSTEIFYTFFSRKNLSSGNSNCREEEGRGSMLYSYHIVNCTPVM